MAFPHLLKPCYVHLTWVLYVMLHCTNVISPIHLGDYRRCFGSLFGVVQAPCLSRLRSRRPLPGMPSHRESRHKEPDSAMPTRTRELTPIVKHVPPTIQLEPLLREGTVRQSCPQPWCGWHPLLGSQHHGLGPQCSRYPSQGLLHHGLLRRPRGGNTRGRTRRSNLTLAAYSATPSTVGNSPPTQSINQPTNGCFKHHQPKGNLRRTRA